MVSLFVGLVKRTRCESRGIWEKQEAWYRGNYLGELFLNDKQYFKEHTLSFFSEKNKKQTVRLKAINKMAVAVGIAIYQMIQAFFRGDWRHNKAMTNERKEDENSFQLLK